MRILCDQHVPTKYVQAFEQESWLTVSTVAEELSPDVADADIAAYAATEEWVVFTSDSDFYKQQIPHGLLVYSQLDDPSPGNVIEAISTIDSVYASPDEITETVPDGWV